MSLLDNAMEEFTVMNVSTTPDGFGGIEKTYADGTEFKGVLRLDGSNESTKGESPTTTASYTLITPRSSVLKYHAVIKRKSNNKLYIVTQDGDDSCTPAVASLDMRTVRVEEWMID